MAVLLDVPYRFIACGDRHGAYDRQLLDHWFCTGCDCREVEAKVNGISGVSTDTPAVTLDEAATQRTAGEFPLCVEESTR
jgi:hypothetical protein